jgi:NADPH:quinone reductase
MQAFGVHSYGGEQAFFEVPVPNPGPGEVLVKVAGAGVGSWEAMIASGDFPLLRPFPLALGLDFSGTVAAIGEGVSGFSQGDAVYAYNYPVANNGAFAEYVLVPASYLARPPVSMGLVEAAAVPCAAVTAHKTVTELLDVREGEVVLVTGGSGGVGHLAIQIARDLGARVVATASRAKHDFLRELGAETTIDYRDNAGDVAKSVRKLYPGGVDKALCNVYGATVQWCVQSLRDGGKTVDLTGTELVAPDRVDHVRDFVAVADAERLGDISRMIDEGRLRVEVQQVYPFAAASSAVEEAAAGHVRGKLVLRIA